MMAASVAPPAAREPIAIAGVGCRLPGGIADADGLWQALLDGRDCVVDIPGSRWDPAKFLDPTGRAPGRSYVNKGGMLREDPRAFDAAFFSVLPREAAILDPQQRLLLQCSWEAFEDAGDPPDSHAGGHTGVFMGGFMMDSQMIQGDPINRERISTHSATANTLTMLSNRLSYVFDLRGPSVSLDAACASSLIAIHQACQSMWAGESDAALAGGVNVMLSPETHVTMAKGQFLSKTGRCQAFSDQADGYVRGEGAVVLLLKPLSAARRDGNPVYAVILGTAANHGGRSNGITVPRADAQIAVMRAAYAQAGVEPSQVCYVEAHGTGTPVGDPVEAKAIGAVVGASRTGRPCRIGSIKTNLGHLEAAAGVAGVLKAALSVAHGVVPPHLHLAAVNPAIDLDGLNLTIPTRTQPLPRWGDRRVAGVNSFGYGGANAHVVLAEPPPADEVPAVPGAGEPLLLLSARSPKALQQLAERHAQALSVSGVDLAAHCRSAAVHRSHHRLRASFEATDRSSLVDSLRAFAGEGADAAEPTLDLPRLMFVYTGMGPQWWAMGRELLSGPGVFRDAAEECDALFRDVAGWSVLAEMLADEPVSKMSATEVAQPANVVLQIALTRLWRSWGVYPDAVVGHSVGELAAVHTAGALSLRDTMRVAYHRSRLQARLAGRGAMLAAGLPPEDAADHVERCGGRVSVAAVNSPGSVTLAGDRGELQRVADELTAAGMFTRFLRVEVPYHSPAMDEIHDDLLASLAGLQPAPPALELYSTVTGGLVADTRHDPTYWWHNARDTVRFGDALSAAIGDGHRVFVEVGPHPVLATSIRELLGQAGVKGVTVPSLIRGKPERASLRTTVRALYAAGAGLDRIAYFGAGPYTPIPKYPWQQAILWSESDRSARRRVRSDHHPMISETGSGGPARFVADVSFAALPFLEDHGVAGATLFPAAGHVELALAARQALTGSPDCSVEDLELVAAVPLDAATPARLTATIASDSLTVHHDREDQPPVLCARAALHSCGRRPAPVDVPGLRARLRDEVPAESLYAALARRGLRYGPKFRGVRVLRRGPGEVLARIALPDGVDADGYHLHPVLLDAALHSLIATADGTTRQQLIPVAVDRIQFFGGPAPLAYAHGRAVSAAAGEIRGDVSLLTEDGAVIAEVTGFSCRLLPRANRRERLQRNLFTRSWAPLDAGAARPEDPASWLVLDGDDTAPALAELAARPDPTWLVDLRWAGEPTDTPTPVADGATAAEALLATVRALPAGTPDRYVLVTRRAEALDGDTHPPAIDRAVLLGVARTVMSERPDLTMTLVDVDDPGCPEALLDTLATVGAEQEIALRGGTLWCARIDRAAAELLDEPAPQPVPAAACPAYRLAQQDPPGGVHFVACDRAAPQADEVEIEVEFVPLHPTGMGSIGLGSIGMGAAAGGQAGTTAVGRISRAGSAVADLSVGDRVHAVLPGAPRSHAIVPRLRVTALPDSMSLPDAAGLDAMAIAYHALVTTAQLQKGETVLIADAAGGVGLAAVGIARWIDADVIATAGSPADSDHLRALGVTRVSASRDVAFYDDVMIWTERRGADVVLNAAGGELMAKSAACLAPFGRFVQVGATGDEQHPLPGLRGRVANLVYASVDFAQLSAHRPEYVAGLYAEVLALIEGHQLPAVPVAAVPAAQLDEALRLRDHRDQPGVVCLALRDPELTLRADPPPRIRPDATYLVTGGLGGFGLETAMWLAEQGARHLALVSRRGASTPEARAATTDLAARGVEVRAFAADVADRGQLAAVLGEVAATMPPLRGVVHSAAVFDDRPVADLDRAALDRVLAPKAAGAVNLHQLTDGLDFFVLYSSISSLIGNPGQANYVAANAALEALAALRRHRGQPASVIAWGALAETGLVAREANVARHLGQLGIVALGIDDALAALGEVIDRGIDSLVVADADWSRLASMIPVTSGRSRLQWLAPAGDRAGAADSPAARLLDGLDDEAARDAVHTVLTKIVAGALGVDETTFEPSQPLRELGVDSLMGLEIAAAIEKSVGLTMSAVELAAGWSTEQLADMVLRQHRGDAA